MPYPPTGLNQDEVNASIDSRLFTLETSSPGFLHLDRFADVTDDAKLTTALATAASYNHPPTILLSNRTYTFTQANRSAFTGMRIQGPGGYGNPERNGGTKMPCRINLQFNGSWFRNPENADVFSVSFKQLSFIGSGAAKGPNLLGQNGTGTWYCLSMRDIFTSGMRSVLGTQAKKILLTAASFTGDWEINNCYNGAFHIGGSDNVLWKDGMLLDSGVPFSSAGGSNGQYHLWLDHCEKTDIGPLYMTAEGPWCGVHVSGPAYNVGGSNLGGPLTFSGLRLEGRNKAAASNGALFKMSGGIVRLRDSWIAYGMKDPGSLMHTSEDAGIIHQSDGALHVDSCTYDRATGVGEEVPFVYSSGGKVRVLNTFVGSKGGSWISYPLVSTTHGDVVIDDTVNWIGETKS